MPGQKKAFPLRIDPEVYEALQRWAGDELRSLNGQIEFLLRESLRQAGRLPGRRPAQPDDAPPDRSTGNPDAPPDRR